MKEVKLGWIAIFIIWYFRRDPEVADTIVSTAFKGYHITKIRKDAGKKKGSKKSKPPEGMAPLNTK
jgi:hypothetical protein